MVTEPIDTDPSVDRASLPPFYAESEEPSHDIQFYIGCLSAGKTITAQTHYKRLAERNPDRPLLVVDPLGIWEFVDDLPENCSRYAPDERLIDPIAADDEYIESIGVAAKEALSEWSEQGEEAELFIDDAYLVLDALDLNAELGSIGDKTLRLISSDYSILREELEVEPAQIHIHRIEDREEICHLPLSEAEITYVLNVTTGDHLAPAGVLTLDHSGETTWARCVLTDEEANLLLD
ncbi:hypothetical protein ACFR9U_16005 [Halorientalis brevis]|uniref:Uncharacterized protein n=1 Tax=Halorientalis brevis TaxID=1126241 RepID=A0ABD6CFB3_9EURY|nr:hypothetical protein [Halorientalis brevis]